MTDEVWDDDDRPKQRRLGLVGGKGKTLFKPARMPDRRSIPPRPWLYGTSLLRDYVSVVVAPGGTGKSLWAMSTAIALAAGVEFMGTHIFERCNVAIMNLEDPLDEMERRLAALMHHHRIERGALDGRLFLHSNDDGSFSIAGIGQDGAAVALPDADAVIAFIVEYGIDLLVVDPFAESHSLEENSNPQMAYAAAVWRRIARFTHCAILLVHHVRKGAVLDIDSARGAKALTDSARVGMLLSSMSAEMAAELGVPEDEASAFIRLDDAKVNMARKAREARWFRMASVGLDNATELYPYGDNVAVLEPWTPPTLFDGVTEFQINDVLDYIAKGPREGVRFCSHRRGKDNTRWAGTPLMEMLHLAEPQAMAMLRVWLKNGLLVEGVYMDKEQRKERTGLTVDNSKRPANAPSGDAYAGA